jgi:phosphotransferase system  glucose/maltose/N-acetylglucosamine-specific IIC component
MLRQAATLDDMIPNFRRMLVTLVLWAIVLGIIFVLLFGPVLRAFREIGAD